VGRQSMAFNHANADCLWPGPEEHGFNVGKKYLTFSIIFVDNGKQIE
jgi:hypothetical protein